MNVEKQEQRRIATLARDYMKRGYTVLAELPGFDVPYRIGGIVPDLIAKRGDEVIITEVLRTGSNKSRLPAVEALAKFAQANPNIRFDLVTLTPRRSNKASSEKVLNAVNSAL